ncbi:MAG: sodium:proline symporter, partial [Gemmatimonadota bacterium]
LVAVAVVLGFFADELVFWLVLFAVAGLGAGIGPASILAIFWKGVTRAGVFAGMAVGSGTAVIWFLTPALRALIYELVPAFVLGFAVTIVVSRFTRPPDGVEEMFRVMDGEAALPRTGTGDTPS